MKKYVLMMLLGCISVTLQAQVLQSLSLDSCYVWARLNYPTIQQLQLITNSSQYAIENAAKGFYPQLSINGQATYQSDVTQVPIKLPGLNLPVISKDQYKLYGDISQTLYDGGAIKLQKDLIQANATIEKQTIEVELYKLKERINQIYFGILLVNEQLLQSELLHQDLMRGSERTRSAIANGISLKSNADILQAEILKLGQRVIELKSMRKAYLDMLGLYIHRQLDEQTVLKSPASPVLLSTIKRPELLSFDYRNKLLDIQRRQIDARSKPKIGLFVQGGYGRPALNMLNNEFDFYYIGGVRLNWSLSGLYTSKNEKTILIVNHQLLEAQKETFLLNTNLILQQQNAEITKLEELIKADDEIITLRNKIKNTALAQLENGVINTADYLREVNAEDQSKQTRLLHEIQLLLARYQQQVSSGN